MRHILKCQKCGNYTLNEECGCGGKSSSVKPPKYSPDDKYGDYRRAAKRESLEKEGIL